MDVTETDTQSALLAHAQRQTRALESLQLMAYVWSIVVVLAALLGVILLLGNG